MRAVIGAVLLACTALACAAGEAEERERIAQEAYLDFLKEDFPRLEARYAEAVKTGAHTPAGLPVSGSMLEKLFDEPAGALAEERGQEHFWKQYELRVDRWTQKFPRSAMAAVVLARVHQRMAWAWRGGGTAGTVTAEDWTHFQEHIALATRVLAARAEEGRSDPNWWADLLTVARLQGRPRAEFDRIADAALAAFPSSYAVHAAIIPALLPRWGGSPGDLAAFADHVARLTQKSQGQAAYALIYRRAFLYEGRELIAGADWPRLRAGFEDVLKQFPDPWNLNYFAQMACAAGDQSTAAAVFRRIGEDVTPGAWPDRAEYLQCRRFALADRQP